MSHFTISIVIILSISITFGRALLGCKNPPEETKTFFYLKKLESLAIKYPDVIQTPVKCTTENEASNCAKQICCEDEIGCCFSDPITNRQVCGCKAKIENKCSLGPPLVYIHTYRCEEHHSAETDVCIRKTNDGEIVQGSVVTSVVPITRYDALKAVGETTGNVVKKVKNTTRKSLSRNRRPPRELVNSLSIDQLIGMMKTEKLYILAQQVIARQSEGMPYGFQNDNYGYLNNTTLEYIK